MLHTTTITPHTYKHRSGKPRLYFITSCWCGRSWQHEDRDSAFTRNAAEQHCVAENRKQEQSR